MLPPAALTVADRLITALVTLIESVAGIALIGIRTPTVHGQAAHILFFRLFRLFTTLMRISIGGIRTQRRPNPAPPDRLPPAPAPRPTRSAPTQSLPRRPGWLLAVLPDIAPAIAADLATILADPAFAALLDAAPNLHRTLRPLLRALGLAATPVPPPPDAPPAKPLHAAARPDAAPRRKANPCNAMPPRRNRPFEPAPLHALIVTIP